MTSCSCEIISGVAWNAQDVPDKGNLRVGDTVVPLYVDQSRDALDPTKSVFEEITNGFDEISIGKLLPQLNKLLQGSAWHMKGLGVVRKTFQKIQTEGIPFVFQQLYCSDSYETGRFCRWPQGEWPGVLFMVQFQICWPAKESKQLVRRRTEQASAQHIETRKRFSTHYTEKHLAARQALCVIDTVDSQQPRQTLQPPFIPFKGMTFVARDDKCFQVAFGKDHEDWREFAAARWTHKRSWCWHSSSFGRCHRRFCR